MDALAAPCFRLYRAENAPLAAAGMLPVSLIGLSAFGLDLRLLALVVLAPVLACLMVATATDPATRALVVRAVAAGLVATALYDLLRGGVLWSGLMDRDPIPHIGHALGLEPAWLAGYTWRYLGNGTGLALAFLALGLRGTRAGILYGLFVCANLLLVLLVSPLGEQILFELDATTIVMATLGHVIYGAVLGTVAARLHEAATRPLRTSCVRPPPPGPSGVAVRSSASRRSGRQTRERGGPAGAARPAGVGSILSTPPATTARAPSPRSSAPSESSRMSGRRDAARAHRRPAASSASRRTISRASAGGSAARCATAIWSRPASAVETTSSSTAASSRSSSAVRTTFASAAGCSSRSAGTRVARARLRA